MHTQANNTPVRSQWDTQASTFFWLIHMNKKHPDNSPNVEKITGYSKYRNGFEAQDKDYLLKRKIGMLYTNRYFDRMTSCEFYLNNSGILDKKHAPRILVCYPHHYNIPVEQHDEMYKRFGVWLEEFYNCIRKGDSIEKIIPSVRTGKKMNRDHFIDPSNFSFANPGQLYTHAAKLHQYGHPSGAVEAFILKVKQTKGW